MAKFNSTVAKRPAKFNTVNLAGGKAYSQSSELELVSLLLTSFGNDQYHESGSDKFARLKGLIEQCDPLFVAKAALYTRREFGMRTISHVAASEIAKFISGSDWAPRFYQNIVNRPDDMSEVIAYYLANNAQTSKSKRGKKSLPNAMKKGFASALEGMSEYNLAKYKGEGKAVKMIDVVNMCHPKYTEALTALMTGTLKPADTWEVGLTQAGQKATSKEEADDFKADVWVKLIKEKKLGYLALLRNLRNIKEQAPAVLVDALTSLTDPQFIKKSLIFPFQYLNAYKQFQAVQDKESRLITQALSIAIDISCVNVKELGFDGNTLVAVDTSGSMGSPVNSRNPNQKGSNVLPVSMKEVGGLFGIILGKAVNGDIMEWADRAVYLPYNLNDNCMDYAQKFGQGSKVGHGTNVASIFDTANKVYDRIIIISDMQTWHGAGGNPALNKYKARTGANPYVYTLDLAGHGTMQFPEAKVAAIAGFSDKIFDVMKKAEIDPKALVNTIKAVTF